MRATCVLVLLVLPLSAQQSRDAQAQRPSQLGTATIAGRVVAADDGRPLKRVQLSLRDADGTVVGGRLAVTDDDGQFAFRRLVAGRFQLTATKPAYLTMSYGMKKPARPGGATTGVAVVLADGQQMPVELRLTRGSVITGVVRDRSGQPAGSVRVTALAFVRTGGSAERALVSVGESGGVTDDRGVYRVFGLPPGDYIVSVSSVSMSGGELAVIEANDLRRADDLLRSAATPAAVLPTALPRPKTVGFVPVYFPGTTSAGDAQAITLGPGEERAGVDIQLQYVSTSRVSGVVTSGGKPVPNASVQLASAPTPGPGAASSFAANGTTDSEGRYALSGVTPGNYLLQTRTRTDTRPFPATVPLGWTEWAEAQVAISGEDQIVGLSLQPAMTIAGRVVFDGAKELPASDVTRIMVSLVPEPNPGFGFSTAVPPVDVTGRFRIPGVVPGKYRFGLIPSAPSGWSMRSVTVGGADGLDRAFEIRPGQDISDAVITLTDRATEVSGRLIDNSGAPVTDYTVIIFPADDTRWPLGRVADALYPMGLPRGIQGVRPAQDGKFTFRNLGPGDYFLGAADDVERGDWLDPAFLKGLIAKGVAKVSVAEGEKKSQDIRIR